MSDTPLTDPVVWCSQQHRKPGDLFFPLHLVHVGILLVPEEATLGPCDLGPWQQSVERSVKPAHSSRLQRVNPAEAVEHTHAHTHTGSRVPPTRLHSLVRSVSGGGCCDADPTDSRSAKCPDPLEANG